MYSLNSHSTVYNTYKEQVELIGLDCLSFQKSLNNDVGTVLKLILSKGFFKTIPK